MQKSGGAVREPPDGRGEWLPLITPPHNHAERGAFIRLLALELRLPWYTTATALVLHHRYCELAAAGAAPEEEHTMVDVCVCCVHFASKQEETVRKLRDVLAALHELTPETAQVVPVAQARARVLAVEQALLVALGFDLRVSAPHAYLIKAAGLLGLGRAAARVSWRLLTESFMLPECLRHPPAALAVACLRLGARAAETTYPFRIDGTDTAELLLTTPGEVRAAALDILAVQKQLLGLQGTPAAAVLSSASRDRRWSLSDLAAVREAIQRRPRSPNPPSRSASPPSSRDSSAGRRGPFSRARHDSRPEPPRDDWRTRDRRPDDYPSRRDAPVRSRETSDGRPSSAASWRDSSDNWRRPSSGSFRDRPRSPSPPSPRSPRGGYNSGRDYRSRDARPDDYPRQRDFPRDDVRSFDSRGRRDEPRFGGDSSERHFERQRDFERNRERDFERKRGRESHRDDSRYGSRYDNRDGTRDDNRDGYRERNREEYRERHRDGDGPRGSHRSDNRDNRDNRERDSHREGRRSREGDSRPSQRDWRQPPRSHFPL